MGAVAMTAYGVMPCSARRSVDPASLDRDQRSVCAASCTAEDSWDFRCDGVGPHPTFTLGLYRRFKEADLDRAVVPGEGVGFEQDGFGGVADPHVAPTRNREVRGRVPL